MIKLQSGKATRAAHIALGCAGLFLLLGCLPVTPLEPGAEEVMIADGSHLPQCKILGHVSAFDTNGTTVGYTSHDHLEQDQINRLKNEAFNLGGNVLVITNHSTTYFAHQKKPRVDSHEMEGDAYFCQEKKLQKPMHPKAITDTDDEPVN